MFGKSRKQHNQAVELAKKAINMSTEIGYIGTELDYKKINETTAMFQEALNLVPPKNKTTYDYITKLFELHLNYVDELQQDE